MRGRLVVSVVALTLTVVALVLGAAAAVRGELSTAEMIGGGAAVGLVVVVCVVGIRARARLLRHEAAGSEEGGRPDEVG